MSGKPQLVADAAAKHVILLTVQKIQAASSKSSLPGGPSRPAYTGAANVTAEVIEIREPALQTSHQVHPASEDVIEIPPPAPAIIKTASSKASPSKKAAGYSRREQRGKLEKIGPLSHEKLFDLAKKHHNVRVGSTIDVEQRAEQYEEDGYSGDMYYAKTDNIRRAEDKLLRFHGRHNVHKRSGVKERRGYIYVILGKKH